MKYIGVFIIVSSLRAQAQYYDELHNSRYAMKYFKEIPKRFEVRGDTADKDFQKYFDDIENIAQQENITVLYKVNLEVMKPAKYLARKAMLKKMKSKKYNIPLKKNSMKLSNFEVMLRKMAEQSGHRNKQNHESPNQAFTTEGDRKIVSTKQIQLKYKPIISKVKTNYTKIIKPVRNRIITLTV